MPLFLCLDCEKMNLPRGLASGKGMSQASVISESGLYKIIMRSDKPVARQGWEPTLIPTHRPTQGARECCYSVDIYVFILTQKAVWRMGWDSNPRDGLPPAGFQDRCLQPLGHPSAISVRNYPTAIAEQVVGLERCLTKTREDECLYATRQRLATGNKKTSRTS